MASIASAIKGKVLPLKENSTLKTGIKLKETDAHAADVDLDSLSGKNIILGVPGAFTPPCSSQVPGYIEHAAKFTEKGVQGIYIVAVNDLFCVQAWKEKLGAGSAPNVHFLADDTGAFTKAIGQDFDAAGLLGNVRSKRYVAVLDGSKVTHFYVEDEAPNVTVTKADSILGQL